MSGTATTISLTVPHSHGDSAWERMLGCLQSMKNSPQWGVKVDVSEARVNFDRRTLQVDIRITVPVWGEEKHTLTFTVNSTNVTVTSDQADSRIEAGIFAVEESKLKAMLEKALNDRQLHHDADEWRFPGQTV